MKSSENRITTQTSGAYTDGPNRRRIERVKSSILKLLALRRSASEREITDAVSHRTKTIAEALRLLVSEGTLTRVGSGVRGDPYQYSLSTGSANSVESEDEGLIL